MQSMRGTLSAWFLHGVCQHETRRHDVPRVSGSGSRVGGKSVASRAEMQMQYGQYGRGDTVSFVGSRLSPPQSWPRETARFLADAVNIPRTAGGHATKLLSAAWYFSDFVERYRATDHEHDKYMEDGTDTQRTRITASYVRHTRISGSVYDKSRVSTRASPPGASAITPKMQGSHGCPRS